MTIVEFFDPHDIKHIKAYENVMNTGAWPKGFLPVGIEIPPMWNPLLAYKMTECWVEYKLHRDMQE
jgi:hypothetical protein